MAANKLRASL